MKSRSSVALAALVLALIVPASAALPRLHITSLTLRSDVAQPHVEVPFHLTIAAHFRETLIDASGLVVLPPMSGLESLGDSRRTLASPSGTDYIEVLTVVAHHSGSIHIGVAYIDAIDARDGKPKRFSSNDLTLQVSGGMQSVPQSGTLWRNMLVTLALLFALAIIAVIVSRLRRDRVPVATYVPPPPPPPPPAVDPRVALRSSVSELAARHDRASLLQVRRLLWKMLGAHEGETLADVLSKTPNNGVPTNLLRLVERAAFVADDHLQGAIDEALVGLERYTA